MVNSVPTLARSRLTRSARRASGQQGLRRDPIAAAMSANGLISRLPDLALTTIRRRRDAKGSPLRPDSLWRVVVSPSTRPESLTPVWGYLA